MASFVPVAARRPRDTWMGRIGMRSVVARTALVASSITAVLLAGGASRIWK
jgi:hypothetical protein